MRIMGIDPGLSGALGLIDTKTGEIQVVDMPLRVQSSKRVRSKTTGKMRDKVKRVVDGRAVADWIEAHQPDEAIVEAVASRPQQGVVSVFTFGESYGAVCGAVEAMCLPLHRVPPRVWKARAGLLNQDKSASLTLARTTFASAAPHLKRAKDNGRAEALLIAWYRSLH